MKIYLHWKILLGLCASYHFTQLKPCSSFITPEFCICSLTPNCLCFLLQAPILLPPAFLSPHPFQKWALLFVTHLWSGPGTSLMMVALYSPSLQPDLEVTSLQQHGACHRRGCQPKWHCLVAGNNRSPLPSSTWAGPVMGPDKLWESLFFNPWTPAMEGISRTESPAHSAGFRP